MNKTFFLALAGFLAASCASAGALTERIAAKHAVKSTDIWYGGQRTVFDFQGYDAWVVEPPVGVKPQPGNPWTWTMQWRTAFVPRTGVPRLLANGYHHVSIDTFALKMNEEGLRLSKAFQDFLVGELGFAPQANLIGMSWGGFFSVRYAARNPSAVRRIYLDCPFLNFDGGVRVDKSAASIGSWAGMCDAGGWTDNPEMPVNMAPALAAAKIPVLLIYGGADNVLDPRLNSELFASRFKAAGGSIRVIFRESYGHHPHGVEESDNTIVSFFGSL